MLKKLKEIFGFPTDQEKAAAKEETKIEVKPVQAADNIFAFPTSDKPEVEDKPKVKRTPKPKAVAAEKTPAKKPASKKPATKKAAPKVEAAAPKRTRKPKAV